MKIFDKTMLIERIVPRSQRKQSDDHPWNKRARAAYERKLNSLRQAPCDQPSTRTKSNGS